MERNEFVRALRYSSEPQSYYWAYRFTWFDSKLHTRGGNQFEGLIDDASAWLNSHAGLVVAEKGMGPTMTVGVGDNRNDESCKQVTALFLDCDDTGSIETMHSLLKEIGVAYIYQPSTSHGHKRLEKGTDPKVYQGEDGAQKGHFMLPLAHPLIPGGDRRAWKAKYRHEFRHLAQVLAQAAGHHSIDESVDDLMQAVYVGVRLVEDAPPRLAQVEHGGLLDWRKALQATGYQPPQEAALQQPRERMSGDSDSFRETILSGLSRAGLLGDHVGNRYHVRCPQSAWHTDGRGNGMDTSTVVTDDGVFICSHDHCKDFTYGGKGKSPTQTGAMLRWLRERGFLPDRDRPLPLLPTHADVWKNAPSADPSPPQTETVAAAPAEPAEDYPEFEEGYKVLRASEVQITEIDWMWTNRIAFGKLTILDGDPDKGKSTLSLTIAAHLSRGIPLPGDSRGHLGNALVLGTEDDQGDTMTPRLLAAGADLDKVFFLNAGQFPKLPDVTKLRHTVKRWAIRLLILDPLPSFLAKGVDPYKDTDMRNALEPLAEMARETKCAVLILRHFKKGKEEKAIYKGSGTIGIGGLVRCGLIVEDAKGEQDVCLLGTSKGNNVKRSARRALRYRIEDTEFKAGKIVFLGEADITADEMIAPKEKKTPREKAKEYLSASLKNGPRPLREVEEEAEHQEINKKTLARAREEMGIVDKWRAGTKCVALPSWVWAEEEAPF